MAYFPYSLFAQYHNAICIGGLFALKQWIFCSLKHDTVPRVKNLYCFYVKKKQNRLHYGFVQVVNVTFVSILGDPGAVSWGERK